MEIEIWKSLPITDDYLASSFGRIKSLKSNKEKILKPQKGKNEPYYDVTLRINGKSTMKRIHVLVALAFHLNPEHKKTVNHKDANKLNNYASNLEWATYKENLNHMMLLNLNPQYVKVVHLETGIFYDRALDAAVAYGIVPSTLYNALNGFRKNKFNIIEV
jgi:hypothetical protein